MLPWERWGLRVLNPSAVTPRGGMVPPDAREHHPGPMRAGPERLCSNALRALVRALPVKKLVRFSFDSSLYQFVLFPFFPSMVLEFRYGT